MLVKNSQEEDDFIEYIHTDNALFHYTRKEPAIEKIILNMSLRFGNFAGTNDPQEYRPKLTSAGGFWSDGNSNRLHNVLYYLELLLQRNSKFISFCTNTIEDGIVKDNGLLKSRMWSQYGDNYEGACLVLSRIKLVKSLINMKNDHEMFSSANIKYVDPDQEEQPMFHMNESESSNNSDNELALLFLKENLDKFLFRKQYDYRDECEFRIVYVNEKVDAPFIDEIFVPIKDSIKGIVFGDRFQDLYGPTINELVKDLDIIPKRLFWLKDGYYLFALKNATKI